MLVRLLRSLFKPDALPQAQLAKNADELRIALQLQKEGKLAHAEKIFRAMLDEHADNVDVQHLLGNNLLLQARPLEACDVLRRVTAARPRYAEAYHTLANAVLALGQHELAAEHLVRALELRPDFFAAAVNLANLFKRLGRPDDAEHWYRGAMQMQPHSVEAHYNLANLLHAEGRLDEAIAEYRRALELKPDFVAAHSGLIYALNFHPAYDPGTVFEAHLEWARRHAESLTKNALPHASDATIMRRLRVAYVSPNFRDHAVTYFLESILECHDRERFQIICYSDVVREDEYTRRLKQSCAQWIDSSHLGDDELAETIRRDAVDILVDLSGHTERNRLLVFARKPAPLQVTWNGYANTTGMSAMDYRISDFVADPPGMTDHLHTEKLIRLPDIYMVFRPPQDSPAVNELPAAKSGYVTFGSFNALPKITPRVISIWSRILLSVENSRLLLAAVPAGRTRERVLETFSANGIEASRIEIHDKLPTYEFLALHRRADIALDPFPFSGTTTTCHTLWMGLPVVTLEGRSHVSRTTTTMLTAMKLESLVAGSEDEYVAVAVSLAADAGRMAGMRQSMRARMLESPLTDAKRFTPHLERAYREIWTTWCTQHTSNRTR